MVSCQEPSPLKERKHSLQCHPQDSALVSALSFVSMGVEARCHPCHSAAHCRHMKWQPCLCHRHPCHGHCHCNRHCHLRHCCLLHHHCRCRCRCPSPSPSAIAVAVAANHCCRHLVCVAVSHCRCRCQSPCHWPLPSPSRSAITVVISVGHRCHPCRQPFPRVVALGGRELYSTN